MNKHEEKLMLCLFIIDNNITKHIECWNKELKKEDTFLKSYIKGLLTGCKNYSKRWVKDDSELSNGAVDNMVNDIYNFINILKARKTKQGIIYQYDFEEEKETFQDIELLSSYLTFIVTIEYVLDKFKITLERLGILNEFKKFYTHTKKYIYFFEHEMICTAYQKEA